MTTWFHNCLRVRCTGTKITAFTLPNTDHAAARRLCSRRFSVACKSSRRRGRPRSRQTAATGISQIV